MDDPFDIFEPPTQPRERSGREQEHDAKISYRKYRTTQNVACQRCVFDSLAGLGAGVRPATVVRKEGENETYYCGRHAQERRDREALIRDRPEDSGGS
jgi:hypothetical protein